ncbi:hypothetical protein DW089_06775 [Acidaminococcus sp. AM05-11]|nr:hypothetical protein DW089_06775 [Acidaminococcus sp. AM05-11]
MHAKALGGEGSFCGQGPQYVLSFLRQLLADTSRHSTSITKKAVTSMMLQHLFYIGAAKRN